MKSGVGRSVGARNRRCMCCTRCVWKECERLGRGGEGRDEQGFEGEGKSAGGQEQAVSALHQVGVGCGGHEGVG